MKKSVDAIFTPQAKRDAGTDLLLRHCLARPGQRVPARVRLEHELGPELARKLVTSLSAHSRR